MSHHDEDRHHKGCVININCGDCEPHPEPPHPKPEKECCKPEYAEAFSIQPQVLSASPGPNMPGASVKLENIRVATSGIDVSMAAVNGEFKVNVSGWYDVAAGMTGTLNPIPAPLPVWTLSLFKNGIIVPGSTFSNVPLSPAQSSNEITADSYVHFNKGDVLSLANTSNVQVFLSAPSLGTNAQTNSAYLKMELLEADSISKNPLVQAANASFIAATEAANLSFVAATAVNLSQLPADALAAQVAANNLVLAMNAANAALAAGAPHATAASLAAATANAANATATAAAALVAANNAVSSLNPANTALLIAAASSALSAAAILAGSPLVAS